MRLPLPHCSVSCPQLSLSLLREQLDPLSRLSFLICEVSLNTPPGVRVSSGRPGLELEPGLPNVFPRPETCLVAWGKYSSL